MTYVGYFLISVVSIVSAYIFICNIFNEKIEMCKKNIVIMFILTLLMTLGHIYLDVTLKLIALIMIYALLNKLVLRLTFIKSLLNTIIIVCMFMFLDIIFSLLIAMEIDNELWKISSYYVFYLLIEPLLIILLSKKNIMKRIIKSFYVTADVNFLIGNQKRMLYLIGELIIFVTLSIVIYNFTFDINYHMELIVLFILCSMLTFVFQLLLFRVDSHVSQKNKLNYLNKMYVERIEDDKIYRHNITNKLLSVKAVGDKKVGKLIDDILENENYEIDNAIKFSEVPKTLVVIFYDKLYKNNNINFKFDNHLTPGTLAKLNIITIGKLTESIGIALDNVITASTTVEKPYLLAIFKDNKKYIEISLINNFKDSIDLDKLGDLNYSTKREVSGKGLFSISKAIKYKIKILNDSFNITFQIKK